MFTSLKIGSLIKRAFRRIPPALFALVIQIASFFACIVILMMAKNFYGFYFGLLYFLLAQSAFSALISIFFKMDWWWIPIHLFFPFLIVSAFQSSIPSSWFLISFLIMLMLYWSTFKTQVPYYPSRNEVIPFLLEHIPEDKNMQVIDVGCGFAGVLLALANRRPKSQFWGVEIAPLPYFISWLRAKFQKRNVNILFGDYSKLDFSNYDLVFVYLSPVAMPILWQTIRHQMRPGSYIFSYEFMIPGVEPTSIINIGEKKHNLYLWRI